MASFGVRLIFILTVIQFVIKTSAQQVNQRPNIIVIIADDVGWNDVSHHGSSQIQTPNIDSLGYNGIILDRHYSMQVCTPSRAALLTGKYPIKIGYQGYPLPVGQHREIPHHLKTLPQSLKDLGYRTHLIGKWHLGHAKKSCTPLNYGYDSHFGYWNGYIGYFDHSVSIYDKYNGTDLHDGLEPITDQQGRYATDLFTERAINVIKSHRKGEPLHLVISHLAGHTGRTLRGIETVLEVHNESENALKYHFIKDRNRRMYAEIIERMDHSVGQVLNALHEKEMLNESVVVFLSDNGAPTYGMHANFGSNFPLRGIKMSLFEGAIRVPAVLYSPKLKNKGRIYKSLFHITDWVPTLLSAADGNPEVFGDIDGISHWENMLLDENTHPRTELLVEIDKKFDYSAFIGHNGQYKLINNSYFNNDYTGESGKETNRNEEYFKQLFTCPTFNLLNQLANNQNIDKSKEVKRVESLRKEATISCNKSDSKVNLCENSKCLFDLWKDPCESNNIAEENPQIVQDLWLKILNADKESVKKVPQVFDSRADPKDCNHTWFNWLDGVEGCWFKKQKLLT